MDCELIEGKQGGKLLYVRSEKMLYVSKGERSGSKIFVCYQTILTHKKRKDHSQHTPCTSCVRLLPNGTCVRVNAHNPHSKHPDHQITAADKKKVINMKEVCHNLKRSHPETAHRNPTRYIFQREIAKDGFRNTQLQYKRVKKTLERHKNEQYPKIPNSIKDIQSEFRKPDILNKYGLTLDSDSYFYVDTVLADDFEFTVFASHFTIGFVKENIEPKSRNYLMDGTFDSLPNNFYQLLIIGIEYQSKVFPLVYILMTRKTAAAYCAVFKFVEDRLFSLEPAMFMTDFEEGMRCAIGRCWPGVIIKGCWFHYKRAINRKCNELGMKQLFNKSFNARKLKRMFMNIPLLPQNQIVDGYASMLNFARENKLDKSFANLFVYFDYWLNQNERHPISVADLNMRTTSSIETMNSWIQKIFHPKPHIFKFIENLRMHESCMSTELYGLPLLDENMKDQKFWPRVRPEDQIREDNIRLGIHRLQNGHISIDAFLGKSFSAVAKTNLIQISDKSKILKKHSKKQHR